MRRRAAAQASEPVLTVALCGAIYGLRVWLSLLAIIGGCVLSAAQEVSMDWVGLNSAVASNLGMVLRGVYSSRVLAGSRVSRVIEVCPGQRAPLSRRASTLRLALGRPGRRPRRASLAVRCEPEALGVDQPRLRDLRVDLRVALPRAEAGHSARSLYTISTLQPYCMLAAST